MLRVRCSTRCRYCRTRHRRAQPAYCSTNFWFHVRRRLPVGRHSSTLSISRRSPPNRAGLHQALCTHWTPSWCIRAARRHLLAALQSLAFHHIPRRANSKLSTSSHCSHQKCLHSRMPGYCVDGQDEVLYGDAVGVYNRALHAG